MTNITPVLLAGGFGTRLWPVSRKTYPKQFSNLFGKKTLFQQAALRLNSSETNDFNQTLTLTNSEFRFIVKEQLLDANIDPGSILIEPESKNTAPSILASCFFCYNINPDSILLISPSDHIITDIDNYHNAIQKGVDAVQKGNIVTFGVPPSRPETGYGYLELLNEAQDDAMQLKRFIEKPNAGLANKMFKKKQFLWNAGIFMFRARDMIKAFETYSKNLIKPVKESLKNSKKDLGFIRLSSADWSKCQNISIDYAIMEKAKNLVVIPLNAGWSDLGSWKAVWEESEPNENGVVLSSNAHEINCNNSLLRSENENQQLVGLGLENVMAIAMPDAVLVANINKTEEVKKVVEKLKKQRISQAEIFPKDHRPWGSFETLTIGQRFQVKRIIVNQGASLSLQSHHHRSEHWIVVEGTAKVTVDETVKLVAEGQSIYIPLGSKHRLENPGKLPMILIEVQTGSYLCEDDIVRYSDNYNRR